MPTSTLAHYISQQCIFSLLPTCALIKCRNEDVYFYLLRQRKDIVGALKFIIKPKTISANWVTIAVEGTYLRTSFPVILQPMININPSIIRPSNSDIIKECLAYKGACGIVRMSDHKGLFSNSQIALCSNSRPNDWLGKKMSDFWIKDELDPYIQRLIKDGQLQNYSYVAKMMDGQNARLTVNARIISWNGEPARLVETINREYLV